MSSWLNYCSLFSSALPSTLTFSLACKLTLVLRDLLLVSLGFFFEMKSHYVTQAGLRLMIWCGKSFCTCVALIG